MTRLSAVLFLLVGLWARGVSTAAAQVEATGLAAGVNLWPPEYYCSGPMTGTVQPIDPRNVLEQIEHAAKCGVRLVLVPPRRFLTLSRQTKGIFSLDDAQQLTDQYAAELPPDTLRKYRATLLGFNLADDYGCAECWGGEKISQEEVAEWAKYARARLPGVPLGVRVEPDWVASDPALAPLLDYAWAQYQTRKGDPQAYYDKAASTARRLGLQLVMGVNVERCYGAGTTPCSAADLIRFGTLAVGHPASCAFLNWKYDEETWAQPDMQAAWDKLLALAKTRPARECRRTGDGE